MPAGGRSSNPAGASERGSEAPRGNPHAVLSSNIGLPQLKNELCCQQEQGLG